MNINNLLALSITPTTILLQINTHSKADIYLRSKYWIT